MDDLEMQIGKVQACCAILNDRYKCIFVRMDVSSHAYARPHSRKANPYIAFLDKGRDSYG